MTTPTPGARVAVILAAGQGKRMQSDLAKVLHPVGGVPMIHHVLDASREAGYGRRIVVVGHAREAVKAALSSYGVEFAVQAEQLGTGHAVEMAAPVLEGFQGEVAVLCGDVPLLTAATLRRLSEVHAEGGYACTVLTFHPENPHGYGRIYRDEAGDVTAIVEQKDLPPGEDAPHEVNSGTYVFDWPRLRPLLKELKTENQQGEYYLTDTLALLRKAGHRVGGMATNDELEVAGVNSPQQLADLDAEFRRRRS